MRLVKGNNVRPVAILLVEDDEAHAILIERSFEMMPWSAQLTHVTDGEQALAFLADCGTDASPRPDLILLDLRMPRISGLDVLARIKADPNLAEIPVVVVTTSAMKDEIAQVRALGATAYLNKPYSLPELRAITEQCLFA